MSKLSTAPRRSIHGGALLALLLAACAVEPPAAPGATTAGRQRLAAAAGAPRIIVRFRRGLDLAALAATRPTRRELFVALARDADHAHASALALLAARGVQPAARSWLGSALVLDAPAPALVERLQLLPDVARISDDVPLAAPAASASDGGTSSVATWNLELIAAPALWAAGHAGAGVVVASLDSGADAAHPDLGPRWRASHGWLDPYAQHATPADLTGHGTQALGLIVGGSASGMPIGVAPQAQWIAAKIFDDSGRGTLSAVVQALQWAADPDADPATDDAADVINNSWAFLEQVNACTLELEPELAALRAAGIAVVFAAGNTGPAVATSVSPSNNPSSSFAVGAIDALAQLDPNSARGPDACTGGLYPELVAPGVAVRTADLTLGGVVSDPYRLVSGSSFSTPHVSGALALLRGAHPTATLAQLEQALSETALDLGATGADNEHGFGVPQLAAAEARLAALLAPPSCSDADGDHYFAEPGCGSARDCDDTNAAIHPGACDTRSDGIDQDCDGADRTSGGRCLGDAQGPRKPKR